MIYVGAGTSGRLAALDAIEIPCTFGLERDRFVAVIAGGVADSALTVEGGGEEDCSGIPDLMLLQPGANDVVIGISASGSTFFVRSALHYARACGADTVLVHEGHVPDRESFCGDGVLLRSGRECIDGSTRLKAGTAAKKALNIISTTALVLLGKTRRGYMIDVVASNEKLRRRAERILSSLTGVTAAEARSRLESNGYRLRDALSGT